MFKKIFRYYVIFVGVAFLLSCNPDNTCNENTTTYLKVGFYSYYYANGRYNTIDSLVEISYLYGIGSEYSLINDTVNTSKLILPLSQNQDSSTFEIVLKNYSDIFQVKYSRRTAFVNYDCGFRTDFIIDTIISLNNKFDSVYISNKIVTDSNNENIKILYNRITGGNN